MPHWLYILASRSRTLYCGVTSDLRERLGRHRSGRGSRFVWKYRIVRLVYFEVFSSELIAVRRERRVKRMSRAEKVALIERENPTWRDLGDELAGGERHT